MHQEGGFPRCFLPVPLVPVEEYLWVFYLLISRDVLFVYVARVSEVLSAVRHWNYAVCLALFGNRGNLPHPLLHL